MIDTKSLDSAANMWDFLKQTQSWTHGNSSSSPSEELKKLLKKVVSFRDLHIHVNVASDASLTSLEAKANQEEGHIPSSSSLYAAGQNNTHRVVLEQKKLAIILVGLRKYTAACWRACWNSSRAAAAGAALHYSMQPQRLPCSSIAASTSFCLAVCNYLKC